MNELSEIAYRWNRKRQDIKYDIELKTHLSIISLILLGGIMLAVKPEIFETVHLTCILKSIFGLNCPFCGMTHDFILIFKGAQPAYNPFSYICALMVFIIYPITLALSVGLRKKINYIRVRNTFIVTILIMFIFNNLK